MHSRLDLNLFVVFDAIYAEGGVSRAAARLHLTQPAISHALARLRDIFADPLFVRQGHAMVPSPLARTLVEPIRRALRELEGAVSASGAFDPATASRRFVIGLRDVMESSALPVLMRHVTAVAPNIDIASVRIERPNLESDLAAGNLDAAIDILLPMSGDIRHNMISTDRLVVVARRDHPAVGPQLDMATYLDQEHILVTSRRRGLGLEDREVGRHGRHRRIRLRCQQSFAACRVVSETNLILTMSEGYARIANLLFDNQILPVPFGGPSQDAYLYWHAGADRDPANRWLRSQLVQSFFADGRSRPFGPEDS